MYPLNYNGIAYELYITHHEDMKNMLSLLPFTYSTPINVLLVSDRLPDFAEQVRDFHYFNEYSVSIVYGLIDQLTLVGWERVQFPMQLEQLISD